MTNIPSRLRPSAFGQVAHLIGEALKAAPNKTIIVAPPTNLSNLTFIRKIREALQAKRGYGWKHPEVDELLWLEYGTSLRVSELKGKAEIGVRGAFEQTETNPVGSVIKPQEEQTSFIGNIEHLVSIWTDFVPRLQGVTVDLLTQEQIEAFEANYDIGFVQDENKSTLYHII